MNDRGSYHVIKTLQENWTLTIRNENGSHVDLWTVRRICFLAFKPDVKSLTPSSF